MRIFILAQGFVRYALIRANDTVPWFLQYNNLLFSEKSGFSHVRTPLCLPAICSTMRVLKVAS